LRPRRRYPESPLVGAGTVIHRKDKVLLVKRRFAPHQGKWAIPGGLVELRETAEQAAVREALEETGLKVRIEGLIDVASDISLDKGPNPEYHYVLVDYAARPLTGRVKLNAESSEFGWFTERQIRELEMSAVTRRLLSKYFAQRLR
jgi:8-oxo-dGTP diphosphatase